MKPTASIELFLELAKLYVRRHGILLIPRPATISFLETQGLSITDVEETVCRLTTSDCFDGPEPDRDSKHSQEWTVAEFNPIMKRRRVYLKISINVAAKRCKCLSIKPYRDRWEVVDGTKDV